MKQNSKPKSKLVTFLTLKAKLKPNSKLTKMCNILKIRDQIRIKPRVEG